MNKFGLALALLALVAAPYAYALEIFSMDCNGTSIALFQILKMH